MQILNLLMKLENNLKNFTNIKNTKEFKEIKNLIDEEIFTN